MAGQAVATASDISPQRKLVQMFDNRLPDVAVLMGSTEKAEAFVRVVKNAVIRDPKIAEADQQSVFLECQKAAQDGLVLDGREAALVRFNVKVPAKGNVAEHWQVNVVYIPMIAGIKKRVRNSGEITNWNFGIVYKNEVTSLTVDGQPRFRYWRDDAGMHLLHNPMIPAVDGERGPPVLVYSAARLRDGPDYEVMDVDDIERIRNRSKAKDNGPWKTDWGEMAKKTVGKRHSKNLPLSDEDRRVVDRDNDLYDLKPGQSFDEEPEAELPAAVANKRRRSAADKLHPKVEEQEPATVDQEPDTPEPEGGQEINPGDAF